MPGITTKEEEVEKLSQQTGGLETISHDLAVNRLFGNPNSDFTDEEMAAYYDQYKRHLEKTDSDGPLWGGEPGTSKEHKNKFDVLDDDIEVESEEELEVESEEEFEEEPEEEFEEEFEKKVRHKVAEKFGKLSNFKGFETWYGGRLKLEFEVLQNIFDNYIVFSDDKNTICECLKAVIMPIQGLANSVLRNKFADKLGSALLALYNTLARFYNFITSKNRETLAPTEFDDDRRQSFTKLNEISDAFEFEDLSPENWDKIDEVFNESIEESLKYLTKAYEDIQKRIEKLKEEEPSEELQAVSSAEISEHTEKNVDIVNELAHKKIIEADYANGNWKYSVDNIKCGEAGKLITLRETITSTQKFVSEKIKSLSSAQRKSAWSEVWKGNFNTGNDSSVVNLGGQIVLFQALGNTLNTANTELTKYLSDEFWKNPEELTNNITLLKPFIIRMDDIVFPIINDILLLYKENALEVPDDPKSSPLYGLIETFLTYLHTPESVGEKSEMFKNKTEMSQKELEAYTYARQNIKNTKLIQEQQQKNELVDLISLEYTLSDIEGIHMENKVVKLRSSPKGSFNRDDIYEKTGEIFDSESRTNSFDNDDSPSEEAEESVDSETFKTYRTMLRIIGVMAKKHRVKNSYYDNYHYTDSNKESLQLLEKLQFAHTINDQKNAIADILKFVSAFIKDLEKMSKGTNPPKLNEEEQKYEVCLSNFVDKRKQPPGYDTALNKILEDFDSKILTDSNDQDVFTYIKNIK